MEPYVYVDDVPFLFKELTNSSWALTPANEADMPNKHPAKNYRTLVLVKGDGRPYFLLGGIFVEVKGLDVSCEDVLTHKDRMEMFVKYWGTSDLTMERVNEKLRLLSSRAVVDMGDNLRVPQNYRN